MSSFIADITEEKYAYITKPDELRHFGVKRIKKGEHVSLIDCKGSIINAIYEGREKKVAIFKINMIKKIPYFVPINFYIGFTDVKKMELIAEKAGEMGVESFGFFRGHKTDIHLKSPKAEKIKKKSISGMKQSDNPNMPRYIGISPDLEGIDLFENFFVLAPRGEQYLGRVKSEYNVKNVVIGPREGFDENEIKLLKKRGGIFVNLGKVVYRVETAFIISSFLLKS